MTDLKTSAEVFHSLHQGPELLVLPNAWDGGSARMMQSLGAKAIATTSSGVAWARGYCDGDQLPVEVLLETLRDINRAVDLPISVDAEGGYSESPRDAAQNISRLMDAGAVGINIEDGFASPDVLCVKIAAIRAVADRAGIDLFINARTDVFLKGLAPGGEVGEVCARARLYEDAGASGIFAPGAVDADVIAALVKGVSLPLNIMARPGLPSHADMAKLGVRRLSAGGAITQAAWGLSRRLAAGFLAGDTTELYEGAATWGDLNDMMKQG